jgi:thiamine kinase-like enzyme
VTTEPCDNLPPDVPTGELLVCLEEILSRHFGEPLKIAGLARKPWEYRSSFGLELLAVDLGGRGQLALMFKDLGWHALTSEARRAKQRSLYDPLREIRFYENVLRSYPAFGPLFYGSVVDPRQDRYWLFIEHLCGRELYQIGELNVWQAVARWLAEMHLSFQPLAGSSTALQPHLVRHGAEQQQLRFETACAAMARRGEADKCRQLRQWRETLSGMARAFAAAPPTLLHGEFYPSNILVISSEEQNTVKAVDWEMAGVGCGLLDLAALVVGGWAEHEQRAIAEAYLQRMYEHGRHKSEREFFTTLDYSRLYIALGWLGCSDDWRPPAAHSHDWFREALNALVRLHRSI